MPSPPAFHLFGFPVHVRTGFLMFMVLVVVVNGGEIGLWLAAFMALFTLLHELGHAFAARATGAKAEIALDFMAGYAAFTPTRHLSRWERAGISFAGPAVQIVTGGALYVLLKGGFKWPTAGESMEIAVLWAGPVIGLFNLLPVIPFDGGTILEQLVSAIAPKRAKQFMLWWTGVLVVGALVFTVLHPSWRPYTIFVLIPLLSVAQVAGGQRTVKNRATATSELARAEALAWAVGDVSRFPTGTVPSPWFRAHQQLAQGNADVARELLTRDLATQDNSDWWPPDAAPLDALRRLVDLLPPDALAVTSFRSYVFAEVLLRLGDHDRAAQVAASAHQRHHAQMHALQVARAAAALGDRRVCFGWLRTAAGGLPTGTLRQVVAGIREFDAVRDDPEFDAALAGQPAS